MTKYQRKPEMLVAEMNGEYVILSVENDAYFGLSGVAASVWEMLAEPRTVRELSLSISSEYEIDDAICEKDVRDFINKLQKEGFIEPATT